MRNVTDRRRVVAPAIFLAAPVGSMLPAGADVAPPHRVVSNYETATGLQLEPVRAATPWSPIRS